MPLPPLPLTSLTRPSGLAEHAQLRRERSDAVTVRGQFPADCQIRQGEPHLQDGHTRCVHYQTGTCGAVCVCVCVGRVYGLG